MATPLLDSVLNHVAWAAPVVFGALAAFVILQNLLVWRLMVWRDHLHSEVMEAAKRIASKRSAVQKTIEDCEALVQSVKGSREGIASKLASGDNSEQEIRLMLEYSRKFDEAYSEAIDSLNNAKSIAEEFDKIGEQVDESDVALTKILNATRRSEKLSHVLIWAVRRLSQYLSNRPADHSVANIRAVKEEPK